MRKLIVAALVVAGLTAALAAPASAETRFVRVDDNFFRPRSLTVERLDFVRWLWRGDRRHNVTVVSGPVEFNSRTKRTGRYTRQMTRRGTYRIVCTLHSGMAMTLRVVRRS